MHFIFVLTDRRETETCCRQSLAISVINYSGRASELGGYRQLSWPTTAQFITLWESPFVEVKTHFNVAKFEVRGLCKKVPEGSIHIFVDTGTWISLKHSASWRNFLSPKFRIEFQRGSTLVFLDIWIFSIPYRIGRKKLPCQKQARSVYPAASIEHRLVTDRRTDGHRAIAMVPALA